MIEIKIPSTPEFIKAAINYLSKEIAAISSLSIAETKTPVADNNSQIADDIEDDLPIADDFICPITGERLDKEGGYPWDSRIHGANRFKLVKTGEWKPLKGIEIKSPGLIAQVRAEFDARRNGTPVPTPKSMFEEQLPLPIPVPANPVPTNPVPPPPAPVAAPQKLFEMPVNPAFTDIVSYLTCRVAFEPAYQEEVNAILADFSLKSITDLKMCTPAVVKSFGEWLVYKWDVLEVV
jgi:hypothetical protein